MSDEFTCPHCREPFQLDVQALLPKVTDLTLSLSVTPGQFVRLDTIAGLLDNWRKMQIAVGESMGASTEVFLVSMESVDNQLRFVTRIVNSPLGAKAA